MHIVAPTWCSLLPAAAAFIALHPPSTWLLHRLCCCCCCRRRLLRSSVIGTEQSSSPCRSRRPRRKCVFQGAGEGLERKRERERDRGKKSLRGSLHCIAFQQLCWSWVFFCNKSCSYACVGLVFNPFSTSRNQESVCVCARARQCCCILRTF